jgi:hypothetical protein
MKTRIIAIVVVLLLGVLLFSYGTNNNAQQKNSMDPNAVRTEAVETYAASLTQTEVPAVIVTTEFPTLTVEPTLTPEIVTATVETPPTANPCYKLLFDKDVTIPDGTLMKEGETFTKTWSVINNGGCAWAPGFTFNNVGGDAMRGKSLRLTEPVPVGAKHELSIQLTVPSGQNGLIQSSWRMADKNRTFFGDTLSVNIAVGVIATPTATQAP